MNVKRLPPEPERVRIDADIPTRSKWLGTLCSSLIEENQTNDFRDGVASSGLVATLHHQRPRSEPVPYPRTKMADKDHGKDQ